MLWLTIASVLLMLSGVGSDGGIRDVNRSYAYSDPNPSDGTQLLTVSEAYEQDAKVIAAKEQRPAAEVLADLPFQQEVVDLIGSVPSNVLASRAGPWFSGSTAWGVHHGTNPDNYRKLFSKIQNAELAFGVTVEFG